MQTRPEHPSELVKDLFIKKDTSIEDFYNSTHLLLFNTPVT